MRPTFILTVIGGGALLLILVATSARRNHSQVAESRGSGSVERLQMVLPSTLTTSNRTQAARVTVARPVGSSLNQTVIPGDDAGAAAREEARQAYVAERIAQLRDLPVNTDPVALQTVLSEVSNPDPEIRQASLDIISQTGNRGVIPDLMKTAEQSEDASMKRAITETIEFLKLPTLTEVRRQKEPSPAVGKE
jgi:hypothetical protein